VTKKFQVLSSLKETLVDRTATDFLVELIASECYLLFQFFLFPLQLKRHLLGVFRLRNGQHLLFFLQPLSQFGGFVRLADV
jgi:hypothetical protein